MHLRKSLLCFFLLLLIASRLPAQVPADYGFQEIQNVPSQRVYSLLIGRKGFVWIGSELGIARYDGKEFTSFYNEQQSSLSMSNLEQDASGRIWCLNFDGQIFYIEHGKMKQLLMDDPSIKLSQFVISGNELIAQCHKGLFVYNIDTRRYRIITKTHDGLTIGDNIQGGIRAYNGEVYYLVRVKGAYTRIYRYRAGQCFSLTPDLPLNYVSIIAVNHHYLALRSKTGNYFTYFSIKDNQRLVKQGSSGLEAGSDYATLFSVVDGKIWLHEGKQSFLMTDTSERINLPLTGLLRDREGNLWASSLKYGLLLKKRPSDWQFQPADKETGHITSFATWGKWAIAGTSKGQLLITDTTAALAEERPERILSLRGNDKSVSGILTTKNSLFVYGGRYLIRLDTQFNIVKQASIHPFLHKATVVDTGMLAFSYHKGVVAVSASLSLPQQGAGRLPGIMSNHFDYGYYPLLYTSRANGNRSRGICYDSTHKILYVGFSNGLFAFDSLSVKEVLFHGRHIHTYSLVQAERQLFVSTLSNKVLLLKDGHITGHMNLPKNSSDVTIIKMKLFGSHLWIITTNNIYLYDIDKKAFTPIKTLPPLRGVQVLDLLELNGYVYLSTPDGLYQSPLHTGRKEIAPLNYLMSVVVNGQDTIDKGATLAYNKNSLQFNLTGLYYANPGGIYFNYRLLGANSNDTAWKRTSAGQDRILFPYIMPGTYTFEVVAHTDKGVAARDKISFSFTIHKVWWQQWWFILALLAVVATLAYIFIRMRIKNKKEANLLVIEQLKREKERFQYENERLAYENQVNESELKALKSQMNPHFISNSLNAIQTLFMRGDKGKANELLGNFVALARLILSVSDKKFIPLATEVNLLRKYLSLEQVRFSSDFSYHIVTVDETDGWLIKIPPMIVQPLVENSIKHGLLHKEGKKELQIVFEMQPDYKALLCTITDNGIGREKSEEIKKAATYRHKSFSIAAIRKRLALMSKTSGRNFDLTFRDLKDEHGHPCGTSVIINIPVQTQQ